MSWLIFVPLLAVTDAWETTGKVLAALAVFAGPSAVVWFTRRGNRADRTTIERTEVEKLYISGSQDLIKHLQGSLVTSTADLAASRAKCRSLQEEVDVANRSMAGFQDQYDRLVALLKRSGVPVPDDVPK